ncbi:MAG: phosphopantetheine-binding protein [Pseudonocardiaceae bacterium]
MVLSLQETTTRAAARQELCAQMKNLLVERLALDMDPAKIGDDQPLFGRGLELDSIDTLELAMAVEESYGVTITDDDTDSLLSLNRLVDHVAAHRS